MLEKIVLSSGKKRVSSQTGFIQDRDAIPLLDNFLYAYALFRSKTVENICEGRSFLEKLLAFEVEGNFPTYLHEFPKCLDSKLSSFLLPPIFYLFRDFSSVLGDELSGKLSSLSQRIIRFLQKEPKLSASVHGRLTAFLGTFDPTSWIPKTSEDWGEFCVCAQMAQVDVPEYAPIWNSSLSTYIGPNKERQQDGYYPKVALLDFFMDPHSERAAENFQALIKASLVHPWQTQKPKSQENPYTVLIEETQRQCFTLYWGNALEVHSLVLESKKGTWSFEPCFEGWIATYQYDLEIPHEDDAMEWAFYLDDSPTHILQIEGIPATLFHPDQEVKILSKGLNISFRVETDESEGTWTGHVLKGDRSFQRGTKLPYGGYDKKVALRTIRRNAQATIRLHINIKESALDA